jgi:hypothetical protein
VLGDRNNFEVDSRNTSELRGLVHFDLSDIPTNAIITSATLYLYPKDDQTGQITYLYRVTRSWSETTATWNVPWTSPGGDFDSSIAYALYRNEQKNCALSLDITSLVQLWTSNVYPNYGILLYAVGSNQVIQYTAKENTGNAVEAPKLAITYNQGNNRHTQFASAVENFLKWLGSIFGFY